MTHPDPFIAAMQIGIPPLPQPDPLADHEAVEGIAVMVGDDNEDQP
jgi:hypothetical protein